MSINYYLTKSKWGVPIDIGLVYVDSLFYRSPERREVALLGCLARTIRIHWRN
jgi:hypothetical protein